MGWNSLALVMALVLMLLGTAYAISPATVTRVWETTQGARAGASSDDTTEAGNITYLNLSGDVETNRWAGYVGNLSNSNIVLEDSDGTDFYRWTYQAGERVQICAGVHTLYNWTSLASGYGTSVDTAWGFSGGSDLAEETWDSSYKNDTCGDIGGSSLDNVNATGTGPDQASDKFETCVLNDVSKTDTKDYNMLFCVDILSDGTNYKGGTSDYELLVPVTEGATETYYFFIDL